LAAPASETEPVAFIAKRIFTVHTPAGEAAIPIDTSVDLAIVHPEITRAAIVFHGKGRDAEGYYHALERAATEAGQSAEHTILLAPQFLREEDVAAHHLPNQVLRWHRGAWTAGLPATGPQALSTFDVLDALLRTLGNRTTFPNLNAIVLIGHSAGAQLLNRYAIVGREPAALSAGIHVRFVIANPSSYFYFSDDRPQPDGPFASFHRARCPEFDLWKYGPEHAPPYVAATSADAWEKRESAYAHADVIYLLGTTDTDPAQVDLDTSCAGEAQGSERFDRGKAYFRYMQSRHPGDLRQHLWFVPDVGHTGSRMVESTCAIAAIFDSGSCPTQASDAPN
jgi:hypothetical protein